MGRLDGSVAVVTGGASGIGRACALAIAREGASVAVADIEEHGARSVCEEIVSAGGVAIAASCDVRDEAQVAGLFSLATTTFGEVTSLVTSAGIVSFEQTGDCDLEDWQRVIDVNLTGTFLCVKHALASMQVAGSGSIVTIGSVSAVVAGNTDVGPGYKAAKGGVLQLTRLVAAQYGAKGIRANCLCPGPVDTGIIEAGQGSQENATTFARLAQGVPMGRGGRPDEIAAVALFLLSSESSFMTGSAVFADGGYTTV